MLKHFRCEPITAVEVVVSHAHGRQVRRPSSVSAAILCGFVLALLLAWQPAAHALQTIRLTEERQEYALGRTLEVLEDAGGQLSLDQVRSPEQASRFRRGTADTPNFGFTHAAVWFRVALQDRTGAAQDWLLEAQYPLLDYVTVYIVDETGKITEMRGGDRLPFNVRPVKAQNINFLLPFEAYATQTLYIRVQTASSLQLPLVLWTHERFAAASRDEQYLLGFYYGILGAMCLFSAMVFLSTRDSAYFFYICYLIPFFLLQLGLNGLAYEFLWPNAPDWANASVPAFIGLSIAGAMQFTGSFLALRVNAPRWALVSKVFIALGLAQAAASFVLPYSLVIRVGTAFAILTTIVLYATAIHCLVKRVKQAPYMVAAWTIFVGGIFIFALKTFKIIPSTFLTDHGMQIGNALEVILLGFALTHRLRVLKDENERIQREATVLLEQRVESRTRELNEVMGELARANEALRQLSVVDPLTGVKNRKYLEERYAREAERAVEENTSLALLIFDLDHFKSVNDTHGHPAGDACLKHVCRVTEQCLRKAFDCIVRLGGEEFAILLPETELAGAVVTAERIRAAVMNSRVRYREATMTLTVSIGIGISAPEDPLSLPEILEIADQALYEAKRNGRNRVSAAGMHAPRRDGAAA
jgi:diguanylate cyclase (GGDEF)-like protein